MNRSALLLLAILLAVAGLACDDNSSPTEPLPEQPEVETFLDTYDGSIALGETSCHVFAAAQGGPAELEITELQPLPTLTVGLGLGSDDGDPETPCVYFAADRSVRVGDTLLSTLGVAGSYCVCIFDVGNIFADETVDYVVTVDHP